MPIPRDTKLIAYVDDRAIVATDKYEEGLEFKVNRTTSMVEEWITENEMEIAAEKTEAILLIDKKHKVVVLVWRT